MSGLEGLFAIVIVALMPVALVLITRYYALREKELMVHAESDNRRLDQLVDEKKRLEGRVENLESIICAVEFDLNERLHQLPIAALARPLLMDAAALQGEPMAPSETTQEPRSATRTARVASISIESVGAIARAPETAGLSSVVTKTVTKYRGRTAGRVAARPSSLRHSAHSRAMPEAGAGRRRS